MNTDRLDTFVDRVAHDLTAAAPADGLADRVRARLDSVPAPVGRARRAGWRRVALAAAATVALMAGATWSFRTADPGAPAPTASADGPPALPMPVPPPVPTATTPATATAPAAGTFDASPDVAADVLAGWEARAIPALAPMPALALGELPTEAIQPEAMTVPLLNIDPIETSRVTIAPLAARRAGTPR